MKKLLGKKGLGLLETIIAIAILAAIALPLLSLFVQSAKTDGKARAVLNANYISQNYTESLETLTYFDALSSVPNKLEIEGYYLTAKIQPYGTVNTDTTGQKSYFHIIIFNNGSMLAVMPDGQWTNFSSVPSDIVYGTAGSSYTFSAGSVALSGPLENLSCVVTLNAMRQVGSNSVNIATTSNYKTVLYSQSFYTRDYSFTGTYEVIEDLLTQDSSLVHISAFVYNDSTSNDLITSVESYITLKNWE